MEVNYFPQIVNSALIIVSSSAKKPFNFSRKPSHSVGNVSTFAVDLLIKNNDFKRIGYFKSSNFSPSIGRLPDIVKSEENCLCLPGEIYFSEKSQITIFQIRSGFKENKLKAFLQELSKFIERHAFAYNIVLMGAMFKTKPDSEMDISQNSVYYHKNAEFKNEFLDLSKFKNFESFFNKNEEKISDLIIGGRSFTKILKKKELLNHPFLGLAIMSSPGDDFAGAGRLCEALVWLLQNKGISQSKYVPPKYFF